LKTIHLRNSPKLIITTGDIRGVGPEVVVKAVSHPEVRRWAEYLIVGPGEAFSGGKDGCFLGSCYLEPTDLYSAYTDDKPDIMIWRVTEKRSNWGTQGRIAESIPDEKAGKWGGDSIETAVRLIEAGEGDALVTAPIEKKALIKGGFPFLGHTEFLKTLTDSPKVTMLLTGGMLRVSLVTTHMPFIDVKDHLTGSNIEETVQQTIDALRSFFNISSPKVAICGLNPHMGEGGILGEEERERIEPVVASFRGRGMNVSGPYPADTVFTKAVEGVYDVVVAMYHDQGLAPFKIYSFGRGVNLTLGLPFIRTSPDHGTAMDISGSGLADERSMIHAIRRAKEMFIRCDGVN
jgi:4-hydroxythreonine-4-phosphate dehydrogenase